MSDKDPARSDIIPPPIKGWSTKQSLVSMDPLYAPEIENFFPNGNTVDLRNGCLKSSTGIGSLGVKSVGAFNNNAGTSYVLGVGASDGKLYNCNTDPATDISGGVVFGDPTLTYFQNYRNLVFIKSKSSGNDVYTWNGAGNIALANFVGPGGDDKALWKMAVYHDHLYFLGFDNTVWWTATTGGITGALTQFDPSGFLTLGGQICYIGAYSSSESTAVADYFVFISDRGEILLYEGDNPGASNWSLAARCQAAPPCGERSFFNWGKDILIITYEGLASLKTILTTQSGTPFTYLSDEIGSAFSSSMSASFTFLTTGIHHPKGNKILITFSSNLGDLRQFVLNTLTGAWTLFTNWDAYQFCVSNNNLFFGTNSGCMFQGDVGEFDDTPSSPGTVRTRNIKLRHAFNYLKDPRHVKQFTEAVPIIAMDQGLALTAGCDVDYSNNAATAQVTPNNNSMSYLNYQPSVGLQGLGKAVSFRIDGTVTTKRMSLLATAIYWNEGGLK